MLPLRREQALSSVHRRPGDWLPSLRRIQHRLLRYAKRKLIRGNTRIFAVLAKFQKSHQAFVRNMGYDEDDLMIRGLQAGAAGYLLKDTALPLLLDAIRRVARGERLVQVEVLERLLAHAAHGMHSPRGVDGQREPALTPREVAILARVARGERSKEIAGRLWITERTVKGYLATIYLKLGVDSRASAVAAAMERGLLPRAE